MCGSAVFAPKKTEFPNIPNPEHPTKSPLPADPAGPVPNPSVPDSSPPPNLRSEVQLGAGSWGEKPRISGCFYPKETPGWVLELPGGEFHRDGNPGVSGALVAGGSREVQAPVTPAILQGNRAGFRTFWGILDPQKNHTRRVFHYLQVGGGDQSSVQPLLPGGGRLWERGKKIPNSRSEKRGRAG